MINIDGFADFLRTVCGLMKIIFCAGLVASLFHPLDGLAFVASVTVGLLPGRGAATEPEHVVDP
jgi:hypothetical protein